MVVIGSSKLGSSADRRPMEGQIRVSKNILRKPTINEDFRRNLSVIAKSIAAKMIVASNPVSSENQRNLFLSQLLDQIGNTSESKSVDDDKCKKSESYGQSKQPVFEDKFQQTVIDYFVQVMNGINEIKNEIVDVVKENQNLRLLMSNKTEEKIMSFKQLGNKYNYTIPLPTFEEFERFDQELDNPNSFLKTDFCSLLPLTLDTRLSPSKCIVKMLKMLLHKDVAVQYTAVKQAKGKKIMKTTNVFGCMEAIIRERRSAVNLVTTDKDITAALSNVLTNAQNWNKTQKSDTQQSSDRDSSMNSESSILTYEIVHDGNNPLMDLQFEY